MGLPRAIRSRENINDLDFKMRLFILVLALFISVGEAGKNRKQNPAKAYKKCRNQKCREDCSEGRQHTIECTNCAHLNGCEMPKAMSKMVQCAQNECKTECTTGLHSKPCIECRKSGICSPKKNKPGKPARQPISFLKEFIIGKRGKAANIGNGTKAQLRCAMGMCTTECILKQATQITEECKACVNDNCPIANATFTCISAERDDDSFNFCSTAKDCADEGTLKVANSVEGLTCPKDSFCCTWDN